MFYRFVTFGSCLCAVVTLIFGKGLINMLLEMIEFIQKQI